MLQILSLALDPTFGTNSIEKVRERWVPGVITGEELNWQSPVDNACQRFARRLDQVRHSVKSRFAGEVLSPRTPQTAKAYSNIRQRKSPCSRVSEQPLHGHPLGILEMKARDSLGAGGWRSTAVVLSAAVDLMCMSLRTSLSSQRLGAAVAYRGFRCGGPGETPRRRSSFCGEQQVASGSYAMQLPFSLPHGPRLFRSSWSRVQVQSS